MGLAQFLPGIFLFLVAGQTADRFPRQRILQCCYVGFAGISALLLGFTLRGLTTVWPVYAVLLMNGVVRAFNGPASQAFLPLVVPEDVFPNAVAWGSSVFQAAQIVGPMIGGAGLRHRREPGAGVCGGAVLGCAVRVRIHERSVRYRSAGGAGRRRPGVVLEGLRYLWRTKMVLGAISLDMFAVLLGGAVALLPVFARDILQVGAAGLGILRGAPGAGAVMMALVLAHRPLRDTRRRAHAVVRGGLRRVYRGVRTVAEHGC